MGNFLFTCKKCGTKFIGNLFNNYRCPNCGKAN